MARVWDGSWRMGKNNLNDFKDFHLKNGSSQGQNLALTDLFVPTRSGAVRWVWRMSWVWVENSVLAQVDAADQWDSCQTGYERCVFLRFVLPIRPLLGEISEILGENDFCGNPSMST